jgi:hypothetical protein
LGYKKLLAHVITVVENPSLSVLGFLVTNSAIEDCKEVTGSFVAENISAPIAVPIATATPIFGLFFKIDLLLFKQ